jgi:hypothetical protein
MRLLAVSMFPLTLFMCGCNTRAHRDALQQAKDNLRLTVIRQFRDVNNKKHKQYVAANNQYGEHTEETLTKCYLDGYDTVQNDDHTLTNDKKLGHSILHIVTRLQNR